MKHKTQNIRPNAASGMVHVPCPVFRDVRGFTLVETLVAVLLLTVAIVGPLTLAQKSLSASIYARNQVTAFYLAQEALEYVRNLRDENNLQDPPSPWLIIPSGLSNLAALTDCTDLNPCGVDPTNSASGQQVIVCGSSNSQCLLTFDPTSGVYGHRSGGNFKNSVFSRKFSVVTTTVNGQQDEAVVKVTLSWAQASGSTAKDFTMTDHLYNWRK